MDWHGMLNADETLRWCGRPAPRCYTFRHWAHSVFGLLLLPISGVWLDGGRSLASTTGQPLWGMLPWLGVMVALYFLCGHLIRARLAWEKTFYAISDQRVLAIGGWPVCRQQEILFSDLRYLKLVPRGRELGSVRLNGSNGSQVVFSCLEHPGKAVALLEEAIRRNLDHAEAVSRAE